jgi:hypothetical protein
MNVARIVARIQAERVALCNVKHTTPNTMQTPIGKHMQQIYRALIR